MISLSSDIESRVTITITTKNRPDDLKYTLGRLIELGLSSIPILIIDDGSDEPIPVDLLGSRFKSARLLRNESSRGLIVNRNSLVNLAKTDYVISLDDDSCFSDSPDLQSAIAYLDKNSNVAALEFNNLDVKIGRSRVPVRSPHPVQSFTGCGHMLRRSTFIELDGYSEFFFHMCEERDYGMRLWKEGYQIHSFYSIFVDHQRTPVARSNYRNCLFHARNTFLFYYLNAPIYVAAVKTPLIFPNMFRAYGFSSSSFRSTLIGIMQGIRFAFTPSARRTPMSFGQYRALRRLPMN
jgi:GT2 family glycosyltransferase